MSLPPLLKLGLLEELFDDGVLFEGMINHIDGTDLSGNRIEYPWVFFSHL